MSELLNINLSDVIDTKAVKIGDHVYQVRRLGVGEELDLNENLKYIGKLIEQISEKRKSIEKSKTKTAQKKLIKEVEDIADQIDGMQKAHFEAYVRLFDDGRDGEIARKMLGQFSMQGITELFKQIFPSQLKEAIEGVVEEVENGTEA